MKARLLVVGAAVALAAATSTTAAFAGPTPDPWPTAGYAPTCDSAQLSPGPTPVGIQYNDNTPPIVQSVSMPAKVVVGPGLTSTFSITASVTDQCSGVAVGYAILAANGLFGSVVVLNPTTADAFHATLGFSQLLPAAATPEHLTIPQFLAWDRYASFILNPLDNTLYSAAPRNAPADITGVYKGAVASCYIVDASYLTAKPSAKSVKSGASAKFAVTLQNWNSVATVATAGATVSLQSRVGTGKWTTVAVGTTSASGTATLSIKPKKSATYQVVYLPDLAKGVNSAVTTPVKVTVK